VEDLKKFLERRTIHAEKRINLIHERHGKNPSETHTYWGGQTLGYWQGKLSAYELVLDELDERKDEGKGSGEMKIEITKEQHDLVRGALERYYYICKDDSDLYNKLEPLGELEKSLIKQSKN
jgi:hypothetical protein